jgi:uncharacterized OB-fold protein
MPEHMERADDGPINGDVELPFVEPEITPESKPFWDAAARGQLSLPRCDACGTVIWYPRAMCPVCHSSEVSWFEASGRGTIYSYTVIHRSLGDFAAATPYVVASVELEEGPRILTNVVGPGSTEVRVGQAVEVSFATSPSGSVLHRFSLI